MRKSVIAIYDDTKQDYRPAASYIYTGGQWVPARPYVYSAGWKTIGGAGELFYYFLEQTGLNYNNIENVLVREGKYDRYVTNDGSPFVVTDNNVTVGNPAHSQFVFIHDSTKDRSVLKDSNGTNLLDSESKQLITIEEV